MLKVPNLFSGVKLIRNQQHPTMRLAYSDEAVQTVSSSIPARRDNGRCAVRPPSSTFGGEQSLLMLR